MAGRHPEMAERHGKIIRARPKKIIQCYPNWFSGTQMAGWRWLPFDVTMLLMLSGRQQQSPRTQRVKCSLRDLPFVLCLILEGRQTHCSTQYAGVCIPKTLTKGGYHEIQILV